MKIEQILRSGGKILETEVLLAHVLGVSREFLLMNPTFEIDFSNFDQFNELIKRHDRGEPVAYLTNLKEFYGIPFFVDKRVLIPRPETEFFVDKVIELVKKDSKIEKVIDIGTGSGNIAVSLAVNLPKLKVTATDVSKEALDVAEMNAGRQKAKVEFKCTSLMAEIDEDFDVIVANLPYIGKKTHNFVSKETYDYEPHVALFGGEDGLALYEDLFKQDPNFKYLIGEVGFMHEEALEELFEKYYSNSKCEVIKDLAGLTRYFIIQK